MSNLQQTEREPFSVLLVDDEENILRSLQRLFMDEDDIEVVTATSGEEGLKLLPELTNLGVIVSDQRMPGMSGAQFLEKARAIQPNALRIILTGYADVSAAVDAINKGGAWRYLAKPWNDEELVRVIHEALERYSIIMENRRLNALVVKQNKELEEWNTNLKQRVLAQTTEIRKQNEELRGLLTRVKENYNDIITSFAGLVEMHGRRLRQHSRNVAELSVNAARELGMTGDELETIRIAALLHDIGKIGIPERILIMPHENMKADELREYRQHSVRGQVAIDAIKELRTTGLLIRHHHESYDGSGFPNQLAGDEIPLGARIIGFADYIDNASESFSSDIADKALTKAGFMTKKLLDPSLLKAFRKVAKYTYNLLDEHSPRITSKPSQQSGHNDSASEADNLLELEFRPSELREGMLLSEDVRSGSGILLLRKGLTLDRGMIEGIERNYQIDAPPRGVFVKVPR